MTADGAEIRRTASGGADSLGSSKRGPGSETGTNEYALVLRREGDDIYTKTM